LQASNGLFEKDYDDWMLIYKEIYAIT